MKPALLTSVDINRARHTLQQEVQQLENQLTQHRAAVANSNYNIQVDAAKTAWIKQRRQFDYNKLSRMLPSHMGRQPQGSIITANYIRRPDRSGMSQDIGLCMADIVDSVEGIIRGTIRNEVFNIPLVIPPRPVNDKASVIERKIKDALLKRQQDLTALTHRFRSNEEHRQRGWRKMLKMKADLDLHHDVAGPQGTMQRYQLTPRNCHNVPFPALHSSITEKNPDDDDSDESPNDADISGSYVPKKRYSMSSNCQPQHYSAKCMKELHHHSLQQQQQQHTDTPALPTPV